MKKIQSALISVYHKEGLDHIIHQLHDLGVTIYSTGGTQTYIERLGVPVHTVEDLTSYPSILDGRVKTLHPKVFGGILARREEAHLDQLKEYDIPALDPVIVDLYPFEETVRSTGEEKKIIEKIDIGGIALIRAGAKNYQDVIIVPSQQQYQQLSDLLEAKAGYSDLADRRSFATAAFAVSSHYDTMIHRYFAGGSSWNSQIPSFKESIPTSMEMRYGENPHQSGRFFGPLDELLIQLGGKEISYNNLVDIDAAVGLMAEYQEDGPTVAVLKHTNPCGCAQADTVEEAWDRALAGDPVSAFGGIIICNQKIDVGTAAKIDEIFYEVLIAPDFTPEAQALLLKKKKRIILQLKAYPDTKYQFKNILNGVIVQETDRSRESSNDLNWNTKREGNDREVADLLFALRCVKHLKSNAICLVKDRQLVGMGCGQTSRVDALNQAILKARHYQLPLSGAVMASDAFFPFPDCVEIADEAGITAVVQPGGSINDQKSIDYCDEHHMAMAITGIRHFRH